MAVIVSWDLGAGGGAQAELNPENPRPVLLSTPRGPGDEYDPGEDTKTITVDVWGFDPKLSVAIAFFRQLEEGKNALFLIGGVSTPAPKTAITATVTARQLIRVGGEVIEGAELPADQLFYNGGSLDGDGNDDGCEVESSIQGIRFTVEATHVGADPDIFCWSGWRVLMTAVARPKMPLVCPDLAQELRRRLTLQRNGAPIRFSGTTW